MELRSFLVNGTVFLDLEAENLNNIMDVLLESMVNNNQLTYEKIALIKNVILKKHRHQFEGLQRAKSHSALSGIALVATRIALPKIKSVTDITSHQPAHIPDWTAPPKTESDLENETKNVLFLKKPPKDAEASNILVGEVDFLEQPFAAFIRLQNSAQLGDLTEVSVPTRFLFILLGPESAVQSYHEIGRSMAGVIFGFCSGQPLTILGLTGPDLVFETMVYDFCKGLEWDYLSFRVWIGLWVFLILLILVATDASAFVCYITRFTEESFATLVAVIFIIKAFEKVVNVATLYPIYPSDCFCEPINHIPEWNANASVNYELGFGIDSEFETSFNDSEELFKNPCSFSMIVNGSLTSFAGQEAPGCHFVPNAFFMSVVLFFGTYLIAMYLKQFKNERFFPSIVRSYISDFAVIIAIILMVVVDILFGIQTPKLEVPREFKPTWSGRGWVIPPFNGNPWYTALLAVIPAILGSILIFMDQQITAVIVNRKEHLLKKGGGYHLDLLIVGICIVINSILGIPWYVASTILSINHVRSLEKESESSAPGEKVKFLGIREQRVTH